MEQEQHGRRVQVVSTKSQRKAVLKWMREEVEQSGTALRIAARAVSQFPRIFSQRSRRANREKARIWWKTRDGFFARIESSTEKPMNIVSRRIRGPAVRRSPIKALCGRGRKRPIWKNVLHQVMREEFMRLRCAGLKINREFLREMAITLIFDETVPVTQAEIETQAGRSIHEVITHRWVDEFCDRFRIITRKRTGNKTLSGEAQPRNNRCVAYHLGVLQRAYLNGLDESLVENYDETHMIFDMDNGVVLEFCGKKRVTYSEVASGREGFTVCMRLSGGLNGKIETPLVIFQNPNSNYPIQGVPDDVVGVTYRTSRKGWMTSAMFADYFRNTSVIQPLSNNRRRQLWIDSCRIHNNSAYLQESIDVAVTELKRFQPNCTSTVQPLDQQVLRSFKAEWRRRWYIKRNELIEQGACTNTGRVANPGKPYYLRLVKEVVDDLNSRTVGGVTVARRAMIKCGLIPDQDGVWSIAQLTLELQKVVNDNMAYFSGQNPTT